MLPTASALDRAMRCPASVVLPVVQCEKPSAAAKLKPKNSFCVTSAL